MWKRDWEVDLQPLSTASFLLEKPTLFNGSEEMAYQIEIQIVDL
jgi:hypothetical protein